MFFVNIFRGYNSGKIFDLWVREYDKVDNPCKRSKEQIQVDLKCLSLVPPLSTKTEFESSSNDLSGIYWREKVSEKQNRIKNENKICKM